MISRCPNCHKVQTITAIMRQKARGKKALCLHCKSTFLPEETRVSYSEASNPEIQIHNFSVNLPSLEKKMDTQHDYKNTHIKTAQTTDNILLGSPIVYSVTDAKQEDYTTAMKRANKETIEKAYRTDTDNQNESNDHSDLETKLMIRVNELESLNSELKKQLSTKESSKHPSEHNHYEQILQNHILYQQGEWNEIKRFLISEIKNLKKINNQLNNRTIQQPENNLKSELQEQMLGELNELKEVNKKLTLKLQERKTAYRM